jgi:hypothetical protein
MLPSDDDDDLDSTAGTLSDEAEHRTSQAYALA